MHAALLARRRVGSAPGHRIDPFRIALCIEGGASRGAYVSGMALAIVQSGFLDCVDAIYGTSAGALAGACLLSGSPAVSLTRCWDPAFLRIYFRPTRALRGHPVIDTEALLQHFVDLVPDGFAQILANPVTLHPIATAADTGSSEDLHTLITNEDTLRLALRATATMPLLAGRPVPLGGRLWLDGGLSEDVPFVTPIRSGATHLLVLRSRRPNELPRPPSWIERHTARLYLDRYAPNLIKGWAGYHDRRIGQERLMRDNPAGPRILQVMLPPDAPHVSRLEVSPEALRRAVTVGTNALRKELPI